MSTSECPSPETSNTFPGSNFIRVDIARDYLNEKSGREDFFLQKTNEGGGDDNHVLSQNETKNKPRTEIHGERVGRSALKLNTDLEVKALPLRLGKPTDVQDAHSINKYGRKSIQFVLKFVHSI